MSFREIPGYSRTAVNNGDFFKNHGRQEFRDETGELRYERTWQVERTIEQEDVGRTIEFGEKSVIQLARAIGYVSKHWHEQNKQKLADERELNRALQTEMSQIKSANEVLIKQMAEYFAWASATEAEAAEL